ncbi:hypothetical protein CONPUDRAFT_135136 [Coniophora puteana RWD-64-598 SS2]|uniref:Uncharacterized protein n=1 Tax=Coniophora puteana (strain RWD-64-598) TaxID=741705 RepID=A0A5M3N391_CONPW|nr:uncharacterized protein CONPUDRAFT_135136 [Coniophora puteana RWD-64-598 SS2]EIW85371.1 hypothetical protein CONPUDRAFT_135136 [Coniophora puteana RWD-64-598 SS2]
MATMMADTVDTQMSDYDMDMLMQSASNEVLADASMDHDGHDDDAVSVEVDMEHYDEQQYEYDMEDADHAEEHYSEHIDAEVHDAPPMHPFPDMPQSTFPPSINPSPHLGATLSPEHPDIPLEESLPVEIPQSTENLLILDHVPSASSDSVELELAHSELPTDLPTSGEDNSHNEVPVYGEHSEVLSNPLPHVEEPADTSHASNPWHLSSEEHNEEHPEEPAQNSNVPVPPEEHVVPGSASHEEVTTEEQAQDGGDPHEISEGVYIDPPPPVILSIEGYETGYTLFNQAVADADNSQTQTQSQSQLQDSSTESDPSVILHQQPTLYYEPLSTVVSALRECYSQTILAPLVRGGAELVVDVPVLELSVSEDNVYIREITLHDLNILHDFRDGNEGELLHIHLRAAPGPRFVARYHALREQVARLGLEAETEVENAAAAVDDSGEEEGTEGSSDHQEGETERDNRRDKPDEHPYQRAEDDHEHGVSLDTPKTSLPPALQSSDNFQLSDDAAYHPVHNDHNTAEALENEGDYVEQVPDNAEDHQAVEDFSVEQAAEAGSHTEDQTGTVEPRAEGNRDDLDAAVQLVDQTAGLQHTNGQQYGGEHAEYEDNVAPEEYEEDGVSASVEGVNGGVADDDEKVEEHAAGASTTEGVSTEETSVPSTAVDETQIPLPGTDADDDEDYGEEGNLGTYYDPIVVNAAEELQDAEDQSSANIKSGGAKSDGLTSREFAISADESDSNFVALLEREADEAAELNQAAENQLFGDALDDAPDEGANEADEASQEGLEQVDNAEDQPWDDSDADGEEDWGDEDADEGEADPPDADSPGDASSSQSSGTLSSAGQLARTASPLKSKRTYDEVDYEDEELIEADDEPLSSPDTKRPRVQ